MKRLLRVIRYYLSKAFGKDPLVKNMHHPMFHNMIEYSFTSQSGKDYYTFKEQFDAQVPYGRYMMTMNYLQEALLRINFDLLTKYVEGTIKKLQVVNGKMQVGDALMMLHQLKSRLKLQFDVDTSYRLASVVYFDAEEILTKYDKKYCDKKIEEWKEDGTLDFFYARPVKEMLGLRSISQPDLKAYLQAVEQMDEAMISALQNL